MCSVEPGWWGLEEHGILNHRYILKRVQQENREKGKKKNPTKKSLVSTRRTQTQAKLLFGRHTWYSV